jgi:hypothetical protein
MDAVTSSKNGGLNVSLCSTADFDCASPLVTGATDLDGAVTFVIPAGMAPFYVDAVDPAGAVLENLLFHRTFAADSSVLISTFSIQDVANLGALFGNPDITTHGMLDGRIIDCSGANAQGATLTSDSADTSTRVLYFSNGAVPSPNAHATDSSGTFLMVNVPPSTSSRLLTAHVRYLDQSSSTEDVIVRQGGVTTVFFMP